jgi:16S rRNA (cytidine1402-2'-O)-methyltransferase
MSLTVIATPIGDPKELSQAAIELIPTLDVLICESRKETSRLLRGFNIRPKEYEELSEHSDDKDLKNLIELCRLKNVGLVSDCGTPAFCDPGALLVKKCHQENIRVRSLPGPSSLMAFLSVCGEEFHEFHFKGFLSQKTEERQRQVLELKRVSKIPVVLMDTPYRLKKLLQDLSDHWGDCFIVLGCQLGMSDELILKGRPAEVMSRLPFEKAEFMLLVMG